MLHLSLNSTCHGFFSAYIVTHSLILLAVKLSWDHIILFLLSSPNPLPYCTSLSPPSLFISLLLFFRVLLSYPPHPRPFSSQVLLPSPPDHLLLFYFSIGQESILCPNGSDYSSLFKFISMHLKSKYFLSPTFYPSSVLVFSPVSPQASLWNINLVHFFLFSHFS